MRISVHAGHNPAGKIACGAVGILDESAENRKVVKYLIPYLQAQGHTVYDDTVDNGTSQNDVLAKIVAKVNAHSNLDLSLSIHLNSGGGHGTECLICGTGGNAEKYAKKIQSAIVKRTGYTDRGIKVRTNLCVLNRTIAPAVLVECCFVDSSADAKMWNPKTMAAAICEGVTGKAVSAVSSDDSFIVKLLEDTPVRKTASKDSEQIGTEKKGDSFTVVDVSPGGNWYKRKLGGWVAAKKCKKV